MSQAKSENIPPQNTAQGENVVTVNYNGKSSVFPFLKGYMGDHFVFIRNLKKKS